MNFIWATRRRTWGFRFLRDGGFADPLVEYDKAFSSLEDLTQACHRIDGMIALRFPDPEGREDRAGRVIPHEFVVQENLDPEIKSVDDGLKAVWPLVSDEYARVWDLPEPSALDR